jgi:hypothetical protein
MEQNMIGKILGAAIGEKIGERYRGGARGAVIGALAPMLARRLFGPLGLVLAGGYAAKKYYDHRRSRTPEQGRFTP